MSSSLAEPKHNRSATAAAGGGADSGAPMSSLSQDNEAGNRNRSCLADAIERGGLSGWASYLTFAWAGPFLKLGSTVTLKVEDLDGIYKEHESQGLHDNLRRNWEREKARMGEDAAHNRGRRKGTTLLRAILASFRRKLVISGILLLGDSAVHVSQALFLGWLIGYFDDENASSWEGWVYAAAVVLTGITFSCCHHHSFFIGWTMGMQLKISTTAIVYDKILRLRLSSLGQVTTGHLVNLATTDVERFQYGGTFVSYLWEAPVEALVILYLGLQQVGVSFLAGFAALALLVPLQALFSRRFAEVRQLVTTLTDERVKLTNQAVTGVRLMKINAWEPALEKEIRRVRAEEIRVLMKATILRAVNEAMFFAQPAVLSGLVFTTYRLLGNVLTPEKVFTTLALLTITQFTMGKFFYMAVQSCSESWVSIKRIETILLMEENEDLVAPLDTDRAVMDIPGKKHPRRGKPTATAAVADAPPGVAATAEVAPTTTLDGNGTTHPADSKMAAAPAVKNGGSARLSQLRTTTAEGEATTATRVDAANGDNANTGGANGGVVNKGRAVDTTAVERREPQAALIADARVGRDGGAGLEATRNSRAAANGDAGGGAGDGGGHERPGLIALKGVSYRWMHGKAEDEHAKIFRSLVGAPAEKRKLPNRGGAGSDGTGESGSDGISQPEEGEEGFVLDAIDLRIEPGTLVGIVGPVGSSKSSLLMAVLREISPESPVGMGAAITPAVSAEDELDVSVNGTLAYASQEPWIQSGTLRENVLFGREMDQERYETVLRDCSLERDLSILPSGDMTGIGDRGVNLSGGQKARVGLARMAYAHADTYLMDDPLSAVDPAVGRELFSRVVCGRLAGSTRILVTHQIHYLSDPAVDEIIVMGHGKIVARGSYDSLEAIGSLAGLERPLTPSPDDGLMLGDESTPRQGRQYSSLSQAERASLGRSADDPSQQQHQASDKSTESQREHEGVFFSGRGDDNGASSGTTNGVSAANDHGHGLSLSSPPRGDEDGGAPKSSSASLDGAPVASGFEEQEALFGDEAMGGGDEDLAAEAEKLTGGIVADRTRMRSRSMSRSATYHHRLGMMRSKSRSSIYRSEASLSRAGQHHDGDELKGTGVPPELVVAEDKESGVLKRSTYWEYAREAAGVFQMVLIFLSMTGGQALIMAVTVWIAKWSRQSEEEQKKTRYLLVLVLLTVAAVVVSLLRAVVTFISLVRASHRLHDRMLKRIIRAPILFFDSNPVGRILNRFTKDTHFMDDLLPLTVYDFVICAFMVFGGVLIVFIVNPWVVLSMLPSTWYFLYLQGFYMKTSREVKRLDGVTRSPVYSQLSETLDGLVTIRAFGAQRQFLKQFTERVDTNTRAYFAWVYTARWLGFRMDIVVSIVIAASCFFSVAVNEYSQDVDAGLLGAALVYVIQLGGLFQWAVRQSSEVENQMVSAERVLSYCRVPQEANLESDPERKPPQDWPAKGNIEIRDMVLRYREDLPPVLQGLNLSIAAGSRVGIVGRTGAGKSSLISALFRLVEYDADRGGIEIDGVDISKIGLHDLRPRMSVVPQTPFLFSGSMRLNLDPFGTQSDMEMWAALEAVQMKEFIRALPEGLDAPVSEGGGNLSVGQRQLLCLARAVLQRSQILVMDEATANIDQNTDFLIQDVVRTSFKGKTVIMVAHRLNTVIDCDQVVVLSEGRVVEADHPHLLLQASAAAAANAAQKKGDGMSAADKGGPSEVTPAPSKATLSSMVDETGPASAEYLRRLAQEAWEASKMGTNDLTGDT